MDLYNPYGRVTVHESKIYIYCNCFRAPDIGKSATWLPVSNNTADPFKYIKIVDNQIFEPREEPDHGNYEFWSSLPLTEYYGTSMRADIKHTEL